MGSVLFETIKGLTTTDPIKTDSVVFRLSSRASGLLLMAFSLVIFSGQFIGDPIHCFGNPVHKNNEYNRFLNSHCWIEGSYTSTKIEYGDPFYTHIAPGVGRTRDPYKKDGTVVHRYYPWIAFFLFWQGLVFYLPYYLWSVFEGGHVKKLVGDLQCPTLDMDTKRSQVQALAQYFSSHLNVSQGLSCMSIHKSYTVKYFLCELLSVVNVCVQFYVTNALLNGQFYTLGLDAVKSMRIGDTRSHSLVFPRMTKCDLRYFGSSGSPELHDAICVLPLNILNEKIYMFLWFWFIGIFAISTLGFLYRILTLIKSPFRFHLMNLNIMLSNHESASSFSRRFRYGDWFVLSHLASNMDAVAFYLLMKELGKLFVEEDALHFALHKFNENLKFYSKQPKEMSSKQQHWFAQGSDSVV